MKKVMIIGISGGSGSGKTTFANSLHNLFGPEHSSLLQQDSYYHDHRHLFDYDGGSVNFDHPDTIDFALLAQHLKMLKARRSIKVPVYDFEAHSRLEQTRTLHAQRLILMEGMLIFSQQAVRECLDLKVYIDTQEPVRFSRRLSRDARERGRDPKGVEQQYKSHVKPMHDLFVEPSKDYADYVYSGEEHIKDSIRDFLFQIDLSV
jgi:uridine kinase